MTIIVQARMSSQRFPGKVLTNVQGKPLLGYLLERLQLSRLVDSIIIATSTDTTDDAIEQYCQRNHLPCFRGSLTNVASRFVQIIQEYKLDAFVRINADSPLMDFHVVDECLEIFKQGKYEIVTNCFKRSFPKGQSVEVLSAQAFLRGYNAMKDPQDLEHVTQYFYKNADQFKIYNLANTADYSKVNLCVDTQEDFKHFEQILKMMKRPFLEYSWQEVVGIYNHLINESVGKS